MKIVVLNSGSAQPILRTVALARHCTIDRFIDLGDATENHKILEEKGIPVTFFSSSGTLRLISLWRFMTSIDADAFVCHYAAGTHVYACLLARKAPLCLVAMGNDVLYDDGDGQVSTLEKRMIRQSARLAELISAKSDFLRQRLFSWGVRGEIIVNYWGVDHSLFKPGNKEAARRHLRLPLGKKVILSARAFERRCNVHLIAEAFVQLSNADPDVEIVFIGTPSIPSYLEEVKGIIDRAGYSRRADFRLRVNVLDVVAFYQAADVSVSVAGSEGFPNSVLEMLSCKTPLIVGKIPQTEELLEDGKSAMMCQLTANDILSKLAWMLDGSNQESIDAMVLNGHAIATQHADINKNSERLAHELRKLKGKKERRFPWGILFLSIANNLVKRFA